MYNSDKVIDTFMDVVTQTSHFFVSPKSWIDHTSDIEDFIVCMLIQLIVSYGIDNLKRYYEAIVQLCKARQVDECYYNYCIAKFKYNKGNKNVTADNWQSTLRDENGCTLFQLYPNCKPPKELWYDGCLQEKYGFSEYGRFKDVRAPHFIHYMMQYDEDDEFVAPDIWLYDGWQYDTVIIKGQEMPVYQFWVAYVQLPLPSAMKIEGWDADDNKFHYDCEEPGLYGTMKEAYDYYEPINWKH